jgi:cytochrome P450
MSYFLRHNENKDGLSVPEIVGNSSILIIAGSETTATLLSGTTFQLLKNPAVYRKLVTEIRSSFTSAQEITVERVGQLQYLLAVFNEGFRMCEIQFGFKVSFGTQLKLHRSPGP